MLITPTTYVQRPPEVDALLITDEPEVLDAACAWLRQHGRNGYRGPRGLQVSNGNGEGDLGFEVSWNAYLVRGQTWGPIAALEFQARFEAKSAGGAHSWKDRL